jgi:hypothetical protein
MRQALKEGRRGYGGHDRLCSGGRRMLNVNDVG